MNEPSGVPAEGSEVMFRWLGNEFLATVLYIRDVSSSILGPFLDLKVVNPAQNVDSIHRGVMYSDAEVPDFGIPSWCESGGMRNWAVIANFEDSFFEATEASDDVIYDSMTLALHDSQDSVLVEMAAWVRARSRRAAINLAKRLWAERYGIFQEVSFR